MPKMYGKINGEVAVRDVTAERVKMMQDRGWSLDEPKAETPKPKKKKAK